MKVTKQKAVALLVALGFSKAAEWDDEKITDRINKVPEKVSRETVPEEHQAFYDEIRSVVVKGKRVALEAEEAEAEAPKKKVKKPAVEEPAEAAAEEAPKKKKKDKPAVAEAAKPEKKASKKTASEKAMKKVVKATTAPKKVERDEFGCAKGTISAKVNAVLSEEWQSEQEIAEAARVSLDQARGRLYYAAEEQIIEYRRRIEYRLVPKKGKDKAKPAEKK